MAKRLTRRNTTSKRGRPAKKAVQKQTPKTTWYAKSREKLPPTQLEQRDIDALQRILRAATPASNGNGAHTAEISEMAILQAMKPGDRHVILGTRGKAAAMLRAVKANAMKAGVQAPHLAPSAGAFFAGTTGIEGVMVECLE